MTDTGTYIQRLMESNPLREPLLRSVIQTLRLRGKRPESQFLRALGWLGEADLKEAEGRTFVGDAQAPLSEDIRRALISLFQMLWGERTAEVSQEDWAEYQRLCRPESPEFILNLPDYYAFFTYSMFRGKVSE